MLNVSGTSGDGLDGDQGAINISGGTVSVVCTSDDVKGIGCDSTLTISGGTNWHGLYSGASVSTTGSGTTVTAK